MTPLEQEQDLDRRARLILEAEYAIMNEFNIPPESTDDLRAILTELVSDIFSELIVEPVPIE